MNHDIERLQRDISEIKILCYWIAACVAAIGLGSMATALWLVRSGGV